MARTRRYEVGVGLLIVGALAVLAFMALQVGALSGFGPRTEVSVRIPNASGLSVGATVAVAGVDVGTVDSLRLDHDHAMLGLAIDPSYPIRRDALAQVRARSVLGEKYIEIVPQSIEAQLIQDGDVLAAGPETTEIDEMVNMLGPLIAALEPDKVADLVDGMTATLEEDPERVGRMIENLDTLLENGATASAELPGLMTDGKRTLAVARSALSDVERRAEEAEPVLAHADAVLTEIGAKAPDLLADMDLAVGDARALIDESRGKIEVILDNFSGIDKWELRRLLREEGIVVRLRSREVVPTDNPTYKKKGQTK
ncbi:MAG: MCE family protein [Proteobacteria bacterium]|nr:MCE family protein [Pseudomonadota bacterium]